MAIYTYDFLIYARGRMDGTIHRTLNQFFEKS